VAEDMVIEGHERDTFYAGGQNVTEEMHMCPLTRTQASLNMISLSCFTIMLTLFWRHLIVHTVTSIDEGSPDVASALSYFFTRFCLMSDSQTAQDYSVEVLDPEADAHDPDEWYEFFSHFGEVASISVALDNGDLLRALAESRVHKIQKALHENRSFDDVAIEHLSQEEKWLHEEVTKSTKAIGQLMSVLDSDHQRVHQLNEQIIEQEVKRTFSVSKIFCIFEHESAQRECLDQLSNGIIAAVLETTVHRTM
jgi:hypothetical protein